MNETKNEIVVYQPDETIRLEVCLEDETVWLTESQMGMLFSCTIRNVRMHLENIYSCDELTREATRKDFFLARMEGTLYVTNGHALRVERSATMVGGAPRALFHGGILPQAACHSGHLPAVTAWFCASRSVA